MKIAILGAGNVALANAAYLSRAGHDVHIWSSFSSERKALQGAERIGFEGFMSGAVAVTAPSDVESCMSGASVVMIAAPAFGHQTLMSAACPHLTEAQLVVIHPVTGLSSLLLSRMLQGRGIKPTIVDLSTSLFTTRKTSETSVRLLKIKDLIDMAAIPADRGSDARAALEALFGKRFRLEPNALTITLNNHNPVYHVAPMLCNLSRAEKKENWMIWENITPGVARLVKLVDDERLAVARYFGTTEVPVDDYFREAHGAEGSGLNEIFASVARKLKGPIGPQEFNHRFITEDVPYALVLYCALGRLARVSMPVSESLIQLTSALYERDFFKEGHNLEALGLSGMTPEQVLVVTQTGF